MICRRGIVTLLQHIEYLVYQAVNPLDLQCTTSLSRTTSGHIDAVATEPQFSGIQRNKPSHPKLHPQDSTHPPLNINNPAGQMTYNTARCCRVPWRTNMSQPPAFVCAPLLFHVTMHQTNSPTAQVSNNQLHNTSGGFLLCTRTSKHCNHTLCFKARINVILEKNVSLLLIRQDHHVVIE